METGLNRLVVLGGVWYVVVQCRVLSVLTGVKMLALGSELLCDMRGAFHS